jgi:uncharacterized protein
MKNNRMRVVLDTNVFISAFNWKGGIAEKIYYSAITGNFALLISPAIIREIAGKLRNKFNWEEMKIKTKLKELIRKAEIIQPETRICVIDDEPDNRILECAAEGKADLIVSGDRHLLNLKKYGEIPIIRTADFMHTI